VRVKDLLEIEFVLAIKGIVNARDIDDMDFMEVTILVEKLKKYLAEKKQMQESLRG